jgi:UDPglucose--hexose-1-phosphate uridylyltransferase
MERGMRPHDFVKEEEVIRGGFCPFDEGNEHTTPPEITSYRKAGTLPNSPGWWLRVVPNKFPALIIEGDLNREGEGLYDKMHGIGAHEVIIETPEHQETLSTMTNGRFADVLRVYRDRIADLTNDPRFRYILIFKNQGKAAGASLEHSHSQLIALPIVPEVVIEEMRGSQIYHGYKERCVFCDIIRQELASGRRVVTENEHFVALAPFASRTPFETWILPKKHFSSYPNLKEEFFPDLARLFSETLRRLDQALNRSPYNFMLHTLPLREPHSESYHWHFEIVPKLTRIAGFEWGSGFYINPTPPEEAARYLREVELAEAPS